jgi:hypothetical protein
LDALFDSPLLIDVALAGDQVAATVLDGPVP